jgi:hypothetical protein
MPASNGNLGSKPVVETRSLGIHNIFPSPTPEAEFTSGTFADIKNLLR